jgi:hypothetical protein
VKLSEMKLGAATTTEAGKRSRPNTAGHEVIVDRVSHWKHCIAHGTKDIIHVCPVQQPHGAVDTLGR